MQPRFCFHVAEFVMCRQPHQKSGCKQPRNITYMPHSTESFLDGVLQEPDFYCFIR